MESVGISVQVDSHDKEIASNILKQLGLNMSVYVNMAIKQLINKNGVPFDVVNPTPSKELLESMNEADEILKGTKKVKGYTNTSELLKDLKS